MAATQNVNSQKSIKLNEYCERLLKLQAQYAENANLQDLLCKIENNRRRSSIPHIQSMLTDSTNISISSGHNLDEHVSKYHTFGQAGKALSFMPIHESIQIDKGAIRIKEGNERDSTEVVDAVVGPANEMTVDSGDPSSQSVQRLNNGEASTRNDLEVSSNPGEFNSQSMSQEKRSIECRVGKGELKLGR